jgi:hypothetical protein
MLPGFLRQNGGGENILIHIAALLPVMKKSQHLKHRVVRGRLANRQAGGEKIMPDHALAKTG